MSSVPDKMLFVADEMFCVVSTIKCASSATLFVAKNILEEPDKMSFVASAINDDAASIKSVTSAIFFVTEAEISARKAIYSAAEVIGGEASPMFFVTYNNLSEGENNVYEGSEDSSDTKLRQYGGCHRRNSKSRPSLSRPGPQMGRRALIMHGA
jgi:hypothetical protein